MLDLSVVMVVHNRWKLTERALDSIYRTVPDSVNWEMIIIDNCSTDNTWKNLKKYKAVKRRLKKNIGFIGLNNGFKIATGEYILSIDNDVEIPKGDRDWFYRFRFALQNNPNVKMIAPATDSGSRWQIVGTDKNGNPIRGGINTDIPHLVGAMWFFHNSLLDDVGYIDKDFASGYSDTDYCLRVKDRGYNLAVDYSTIWHHEKSSTPLDKSYNIKKEQSHKKFWEKWGKQAQELYGKN